MEFNTANYLQTYFITSCKGDPEKLHKVQNKRTYYCPMRVTGNEIVVKNNVTHSWQHLRTVARQRNTLLCLSCNNLWKKLQQHLRTVAATSDNSCCNTEQLQGKRTHHSCRAKEHRTHCRARNTLLSGLGMRRFSSVHSVPTEDAVSTLFLKFTLPNSAIASPTASFSTEIFFHLPL